MNRCIRLKPTFLAKTLPTLDWCFDFSKASLFSTTVLGSKQKKTVSHKLISILFCESQSSSVLRKNNWKGSFSCFKSFISANPRSQLFQNSKQKLIWKLNVTLRKKDVACRVNGALLKIKFTQPVCRDRGIHRRLLSLFNNICCTTRVYLFSLEVKRHSWQMLVRMCFTEWIR